MSPASRARPARRGGDAAPAAVQESLLHVTQTRSAIGTKPKHRATLRALGLRRRGASNVLPDRPEIRGMLARVPHLVEVAPAPAGTTRTPAGRAADSRGAAGRQSAADPRGAGGPADVATGPADAARADTKEATS